MAYQGINTGTSPNDGLGDTLLDGGVKINSNFSELYNIIGDGTSTFVGVVTQISAGTNVSITTAYGSVEVSAPTPTNLQTDNLRVTGITTLGATNGIGTVTMGIGVTALYVDGSARVTGVLTVGTGSITLESDRVHVGSGITIDANNNTMVLGDNITMTASSGAVDVTTMTAGSATVSGHSTATTLASSSTATFAGDVSLGSSLSMGDSNKILIGDNDELQISHSDSTGNLIETKSGSFNIKADSYNAISGTGNTTIFSTNVDGNYGIELYYLNDKKLETRSSGVRALGGFQVISGVTTVGVLTATTLYGDGSNLTGLGAASTSHINADTLVVTGITTLGVVTGATYFGDGSNLSGIAGINTTKINTTEINNSGITTLTGLVEVGSGATISGIATFNQGFQVGGTLNVNESSTSLFFDASASDRFQLKNTLGQLDLQGNSQVRALKSNTNELMFRGISDGAFEAFWDGNKKFETSSIGATVTGTLSAGSFIGDGSGLTGVVGSGSGIIIDDSDTPIGTAGTINFGTGLTVTPVSAGVVTVTSSGGGGSGQPEITWTLGSNGSSDYTFTGSGFSGATNDPTLYLVRGQTYKFDNQSSGHPFRIQSTTATPGGGTQYNTGVTNQDATGGTASHILTFIVPMDAPDTLYYQCTSHSTMFGTINVIGASSLPSRTSVSGATASIADNDIGNIDITGFKSYNLMKVGLSTAGWFRLYTDSSSRTADASRSVGIDPNPGSGVIAEVVTTGISTTQLVSPFVPGGNMDEPATTTMYASVKNLSGVTQSISVNLTLLQLED